MSSHESFMALALEEARAALEHNDVPIGAVVVQNDTVIARAHNEREKTNDPTAHAEILALKQASQVCGSWMLPDCILYVTLEPCFMCAGAIVNARVHTLVFGAADPKGGACESLANVVSDSRLNHRAEVVNGVLAEQSGELLRSFFSDAR